eukprot:1797686-Rhodomonas_salina.1
MGRSSFLQLQASSTARLDAFPSRLICMRALCAMPGAGTDPDCGAAAGHASLIGASNPSPSSSPRSSFAPQRDRSLRYPSR